MSMNVLAKNPGLRDFEIFKDSQVQAKKVLEKKIAWQTYADSKILTAADVGIISDYDHHTRDEQLDFLNEQGPALARVLVKAVENINNPETVQYLLALTSVMLQEDESRARFFHQIDSVDCNPYIPFIKLLRNGDQSFTINKSCNILAILFSTIPNSDCNVVGEYLSWLADQLDKMKGADLLNVVHSLKIVLKKSHGVQQVFVTEGGLKNLCALLKKEPTNTQLMYLAAFCFLCLSFNRELHHRLAEHDIVKLLVDLLRSGPREKVVRVIFGTLRNMLDVPAFSERMLTSGLLKLLPALQNRKLADDDLAEDVKLVDETLEKYVGLLSSYEKYQTEVSSGTLEWSPVHNEKFWRENISKFEDDNFQLIKHLVEKLMDADSDVTVAVACYDLGEFARFHPTGRQLLSQFGGKKKLMSKMKHPNPEVSKHALLAVQKLMVHNWDSFSALNR